VPGHHSYVSGILAERQHITVAEAFTLMRTYARNHNRPLPWWPRRSSPTPPTSPT
jgi:hypothetical protein